MAFILGVKKEMTQIFNDKGEVVPVTVIETQIGEVREIKSMEKHGYSAAQVKFAKKIKEFAIQSGHSLKVGDKITLEEFNEGDKLKITGISIGKGFQGGVKRHGFSGGPKSHGHRHVLRTIGSIGSAFPQHVLKGRKMPGRAGGKKVSVKSLKLVKIDKANNLIAVKGAVPGKRGNILTIIKCQI